MEITESGKGLIKQFEGCRLDAYRDAVGVWTIGYGHTSAAGLPVVTSGMQITQDQADQIFDVDIGNFSAGVRALIQVDLNDNQFSAMTSFAYNVGLGNFERSSVLSAINSGDFNSVPRRLQLWVRGRGRVLPGLVRRRAAEAHLWATPVGASGLLSDVSYTEMPPEQIAEMQECRGAIGPITSKPMSQSSTIWATVTAAAAGLWETIKPVIYQVQDIGWTLMLKPEIVTPMVIAAIIVTMAVWVINERWKKSADEGV